VGSVDGSARVELRRPAATSCAAMADVEASVEAMLARQERLRRWTSP